MKLVIVFFICFLCVNCNLHILKSLKISNDDKAAIPLEIISNYLKKYFYHKQVYFAITFMSSNAEQEHYQEDFITKSILIPDFRNCQYNILNRLDPIQRENAFNLVFVDGIESLKEVLHKSTVLEFHLDQKYLVIVSQEVTNATESLNEIFTITQLLHLQEVNVLINEKDSMIWTLNYYSLYDKDCYSGTVHELVRFSPENYTLPLQHSFKDLFHPKSFKFPNCPLFVAAFQYQPYVIVENKHHGSGETSYTGFDVKVVEEIVKTVNLIPKYIIDKNRGNIFKNGSATGAMRKVVDGEADMVIGYYGLTKDRANVLSHPRYYIQSSIVFAFAESDSFVTPLARLLSPFQSSLWIAILSLLILSIVVILLTKKLTRFQRHFIIGGYRNRTPILNMFSVVIGNPIANRRMMQRRYFGVFAKTLMILWIFFWLIVRNAYQGSLYDFLQSERVTSLYDTYDKVRESNCNIYAYRTAYAPEHLDEKRIRRHDYDALIPLEKLSTGEWDGVALSTSMSVNYFNKIGNSPRRIDYTQMMPEIYVFYFMKNSPLTSLFSEKIHSFFEAGLLNRWVAEYDYEQKIPKYKRAESLTITNISGILKITVFMYLICIGVFILEILSGRYQWIKIFLDFLTY